MVPTIKQLLKLKRHLVLDKQKLQERQQQILELVRQFCVKKLDDEYFELANRLISKLGRKRNVPYSTGQIEVWAAAIIHALGTINFLFDKASEPYVSVDDINVFSRQINQQPATNQNRFVSY